MLETTEAIKHIQSFFNNDISVVETYDNGTVMRLNNRSHIQEYSTNIMNTLQLKEVKVQMNVCSILTFCCIDKTMTMEEAVKQITAIASMYGVTVTSPMVTFIKDSIRQFVSVYPLVKLTEKDALDELAESKELQKEKDKKNEELKKELLENVIFNNYCASPTLDKICLYDQKTKVVKVMWDLPHITKREQIKTNDKNVKKLVYYEMNINDLHYRISKENLGNGKYRNEINISNLEKSTSYGAYATCISVLADKLETSYLADKIGIQSYEVEGAIKYGYMHSIGKMVLEDGTFHSNFSYHSYNTEDEKKLWETMYNNREITSKELKELYNFHNHVTLDGSMMILLCSEALVTHYSTIKNTGGTIGHSIFVYGKGGTGKTEVVSFSSLTYPYKFRRRKQATFDDTATKIYDTLVRSKDTSFSLDDCTQPLEAQLANRDKTSINIVRSILRSIEQTRELRGRSNREHVEETPSLVQTLPTFTSEYYPPFTISDLRRTLIIKATPENFVLERNRGKYCIENMNSYAQVQFSLGCMVHHYQLKNLNEYGIDTYGEMLQKQQSNCKEQFEKKLRSKWEKEQNIPFPSNSINVFNTGASILLGAYILDKATNNVTSYSKDVMTFLVDMLYKHILTTENIKTNEEGYNAFTYGLRELSLGIGQKKEYIIEGIKTKLVIAPYQKDINIRELEYKGVKIAPEQLGYEEGKTDKEWHEKLAYSKVAIYYDYDRNLAYVTEIGLKAILQELQHTEDFKDIITVTALTKIANQQKLIVSKGTDNRLLKQCKIRAIQQRCLVIALDMLFKLLHDTEEVTESDIIVDSTLSPIEEGDKQKAVEEAGNMIASKKASQDTNDILNDLNDF